MRRVAAIGLMLVGPLGGLFRYSLAARRATRALGLAQYPHRRLFRNTQSFGYARDKLAIRNLNFL